MKKIFVIGLILMTCSTVLAESSVSYHRNMPQGTFKEKRGGEIVHYDKNGKKVGVYKSVGGRYVKIK